MARKKKYNRISVGGLRPMPGQTKPNTIILAAPKRFGIDISSFISAVNAADNIDFYRRTRLYDLYDDIMIDTHLTSVIERRRNAVNGTHISFQRNGIPDETINEQLRSPWFGRLVGDIIDAKFYGFSLMQFYRDEHGWVNYDLIPRKHVDPVRRAIMRFQDNISGTPWDEYPNLLFVGQPRDLGMLVKAAPWVIYKRNDVADWAQFAEIFGMPIEDYTYDNGDEEARERTIQDAKEAGALKKYIHAKDVELKLLESGNKTGSSDLYDKLCERCNKEMSKLFLGNTLTTEAQSTGSEALGNVHKKEEDQILKADQKYVLNVLNYDMTDIFTAMGIDTSGGEFVFPEPKSIDLTAKANILVQLNSNWRLPISDDYLYDTFGIEKPANYNQLKKQIEESHLLTQVLNSNIQIPQSDESPSSPTPVSSARASVPGSFAAGQHPCAPVPADSSAGFHPSSLISSLLSRFFAKAPHNRGAALEW